MTAAVSSGRSLSRASSTAAIVGPTVLRVPIAIAQFIALALVARSAGSVAFGLVVFAQTATRLGSALSLRGAGPLVLRRYATDSVESARGVLRSEIRSSTRLVPVLLVPIVVVLGVTFDLSSRDQILLGALLVLQLALGNVVRLGSEAVKGRQRPTAALGWEFGPAPIALVLVALLINVSGVSAGLIVLGALVVGQLMSVIGLMLSLIHI